MKFLTLLILATFNPLKGITRDTVVFVICLGLSLGLLFLNKLSSDYIGNIDGDVNYVNLPQGKISAAPLQKDIELYVETTGFKLLWAKMRRPLRLSIDVSNLSRQNFTLTDNYIPSLRSQLPEGYRLMHVKPDTLFFSFDDRAAKKVPVEPDIQISFKKQFDFSEPMLIRPDSIEISGPANVIEGIHSWKTQKKVFEELDHSVQEELPLVMPQNANVHLNPPAIRYTIPVEHFTEKRVDVEVEKRNVPAKKEISIYPRTVQLLFRVPMSSYEQVQDTSFKVVADFAGVDLSKSKYVSLTVEKAPGNIRSLDYSPKSVEYILYN